MPIFKKKQPEPQPGPNKPVSDGKFRTFAYYLAWLAFLSAIGSTIFDSLKDHEPPQKDDYYK